MSHSLRGQRLSPSTHKAVYLWGRGPLGHDLGAYLRSGEVEDGNKIAQVLALEHGCPLGILDGTWAVALLGDVDEGEFDALTRNDPAVMGWTADRNASCAPSIALRNALNSLKPTELDQFGEKVAARFLRPNPPPEAIAAGRQLVSRDGRLVVFDDVLSQWCVGEYVTT